MSKSGGKGSAPKGGHAQQQRSNVHNPNNPAHRAAQNNRANQMNPNNPSHPSAARPSGEPPSETKGSRGGGDQSG